jgi:hypothetical protein
MAVMGSGDIVVGSKPSKRKPKTVIVDNPAKRTGASLPRNESSPGNVARRSGAMSQQRSDDGATSTPQKFVHLVGCCDPKAGGQKKR